MDLRLAKKMVEVVIDSSHFFTELELQSIAKNEWPELGENEIRQIFVLMTDILKAIQYLEEIHPAGLIVGVSKIDQAEFDLFVLKTAANFLNERRADSDANVLAMPLVGEWQKKIASTLDERFNSKPKKVLKKKRGRGVAKEFIKKAVGAVVSAYPDLPPELLVGKIREAWPSTDFGEKGYMLVELRPVLSFTLNDGRRDKKIYLDLNEFY